MNKQELIEELKETEEKFFEVATNVDTEMSTRNVGVGVYTGIKIARTHVDRLEEPQKVKLPKAAEPWLKHAQYSTDVIDLFSAVEYATNSDGFISENWQWSGKFYDWLSEDADTLYLLCDALRYGYEIEKEPRWVVKYSPPFVNELRYYSMDENFFDITESTWTSDKEDAYPFTEKEKAEALALLVDGSVEEV